jgi:hypothetical protein
MDLGEKLREISQRRTCKVCGAVFETNENETALVQFAEHSTIHNPRPEQWAKAYDLMQEAREKAKKSG